MAPRAVDPVWLPITAPTPAPAAAPTTAPFSRLPQEAQADSCRTVRAISAEVGAKRSVCMIRALAKMTLLRTPRSRIRFPMWFAALSDWSINTRPAKVQGDEDLSPPLQLPLSELCIERLHQDVTWPA